VFEKEGVKKKMGVCEVKMREILTPALP